MDTQSAGAGVAIDVRRRCFRLLHGNRHGTLGTYHVFHEKGRFTHHGAPACLVPPHGAIIEGHVKVAIVVHVLVNFIGQPRPYRMDVNGLGTRHLAHDIDIMHAAINDRAD